MSDFKTRLHNETFELQIKLNKLEEFLCRDLFLKLDFDQQCLLKTQATFMKGYLDILNMRMVALMASEKKNTEIPNTPPEGFEYWSDHPDFPIEGWQHETGEDDTRAGYWQWVRTQLTEN